MSHVLPAFRIAQPASAAQSTASVFSRPQSPPVEMVTRFGVFVLQDAYIAYNRVSGFVCLIVACLFCLGKKMNGKCEREEGGPGSGEEGIISLPERKLRGGGSFPSVRSEVEGGREVEGG